MKSRAFAWFGALSIACGPAVDLPGDSADETSTSTTSVDDSSDPSTTTAMPSTAGPTTAQPTTAGPTTDTNASTTGTPPPPPTATGPSEACVLSPEDDDCQLCTKDLCCEAYLACFANPDCDCVVSCINDSELPLPDSLPMCQEACAVESLPTEAIGLQACVVANCPDCGI